MNFIMTRKTFIRKLKSKLWLKLSRSEINEITREYNSYFDSAEDINEAIASCGDIDLIVEERLSPNPNINYIPIKTAIMIIIAFHGFFYFNVYFDAPLNPLVFWLSIIVNLILVGKDSLINCKIVSPAQKKLYKNLAIGLSFYWIFLIGLNIINFNIAFNYIQSQEYLDALEYIKTHGIYSPHEDVIKVIDSLFLAQNSTLVIWVILGFFTFRLGIKTLPFMIANIFVGNATMAVLTVLGNLDFSFYDESQFIKIMINNLLIESLVFLIIGLFFYLGSIGLFKPIGGIFKSLCYKLNRRVRKW